MVLGVPIVLSVLIVIASAMATMWGHDQALATLELQERVPFRFVEIYLSVGWLIGFYYLLQSLLSDRKDKSILYWKSLPISELQNVLNKLLFGCFVIPFIYLLIAWLIYLILTVLGMGAVLGLDNETMQYVQRTFNASKLFVWPTVGFIVAVFWGAPIFGLLLMVSAAAKKSPLLLLILPLIVLSILEQLIFNSDYVSAFINGHMPFAVLETLKQSAGVAQLFQTYFIDQWFSMLTGLIAAGFMIYCAVWFRNYRFDV